MLVILIASLLQAAPQSSLQPTEWAGGLGASLEIDNNGIYWMIVGEAAHRLYPRVWVRASAGGGPVRGLGDPPYDSWAMFATPAIDAEVCTAGDYLCGFATASLGMMYYVNDDNESTLGANAYAGVGIGLGFKHFQVRSLFKFTQRHVNRGQTRGVGLGVSLQGRW